MTLQELIRKVTKAMGYQHGLVLLTVNNNATAFVEETFPGITELKYSSQFDRLPARKLREEGVKEQKWLQAMFVTHNPHSWFDSEADISIHIWGGGDNFAARLMKQRGVESRTITEDIVLDRG